MSRDNATLNKTTVTDAITLYTFTDKEAKHADTISVIVQDNQALLIDVAYPEYAERVAVDLQEQGIIPEVVVLSHYHPDHVSGLVVFPQCEIYADEHYVYNYGNCKIWAPDFIYIKPKFFIQEGDGMSFGKFNLEFYRAPGHCRCGVIASITEDILHTGDIIMITRDGKNSLPYITDGGSFEDHIRSLELIKKLDPETILVPHGGMIKGKETIADLVEERLYYLHKTFESKGQLPLQQCLPKDVSTYEHLEFHDLNLIRLL